MFQQEDQSCPICQQRYCTPPKQFDCDEAVNMLNKLCPPNDVTFKVARKLCTFCYQGLILASNFQKKYEEAVERLGGEPLSCDRENRNQKTDERETPKGSNNLWFEEKKKARPFVCEICGRRFQTKGLVQTHIDRHLAKPNPYQCKKCGKQFLVKTHFSCHDCTNPKIKTVM